MVNVRIYYNTGFSQNNPPMNASVLDTLTFKDFPALDIVQMFCLDSVRIKAFEYDLFNADYMRLSDTINNKVMDAYYNVDYKNIRMTSLDVAEIPIRIDPFLTCGGSKNIDFISGFVERSSKGYYDYNELITIDDMLLPLGPENMQMYYHSFEDEETTYNILLKSYVDLQSLYNMPLENFKYTYLDDGIQVPTFPLFTGEVQYCTFNVKDPSAGVMPVNKSYKDTSGFWQIAPSIGALSNIISKLTAYGATDAIMDSIILPSYAASIQKLTADSWIVSSVTANTRLELKFNLLKALGIDAPIEEDENNSARNLRYFLRHSEGVLGIMTASGETDEVPLMDLNLRNITINCDFDPMPTGCPYFSITRPYRDLMDIKEQVDPDNPNVRAGICPPMMYPNVCKGQTWAKANLTTIGINGGAVNREKFSNDMLFKDYNSEPIAQATSQGGIWNMGKTMFKEAAFNYLGFDNDNVENFIWKSALGSPSEYNRYIEKAKEITDYNLSVSVPSTIVMSVNSPAIRDYYGNGVLIYIRTKAPLSIQDPRYDYYKYILGRFGYKRNASLNNDYIDPGDNEEFVYIETKGVQCIVNQKATGILPMSLLEELNSAFNIGLRIWKTRPHS